MKRTKTQQTVFCLHESNPFGGFTSSHKRFCYNCDSDAEAHVAVYYWCGNMCSKHAGEFVKRNQREGATNDPFLMGLEVAADG